MAAVNIMSAPDNLFRFPIQALGPKFSHETVAKAAEDSRVPVTAVTAAITYYPRHREAIETHLAINAAAVS